MQTVMYVAIGGALGSLSRYGVGVAAARFLGKGFPWGTLAVNVAGCFIMGIVLQLIAELESSSGQTSTINARLAILHSAVAVGYLGGLTTFSSFSGDTIRQLQAGHSIAALTNVTGNVLLSLVAAWIGLAVTRAFR